MDNLVLIRVAAALRTSLEHAVLRDVREESPHRSRWIFEVEQGTRSVSISLRPELPWIGRPAERSPARGAHSTPVGVLARKLLRGAVLAAVSKPTPDRIVRLEFAEGHVLIVELATHGANLILLDAHGKTLATARRPKSSQQRLTPGTRYAPPPIPRRLMDPFGKSAQEIDRRLAALEREGETGFEALRRHFFGVGSEGARLVVAEAAARGRSAGAVLAERLQRLERGEDEPAIACDRDPLAAAARGELAPGEIALLPWTPSHEDLASPARLVRRVDAAATAGLYHEALERAQLVDLRARGLRTLLDGERDRVCGAEQRAENDLESFQDPDRYRRWGEALLAGLSRARRVGDVVWVPDPYASDGTEIPVPAAPGTSVQAVASAHFRRHRRARRGVRQAAERRRTLRERRIRLECLARRFESARGIAALDDLEEAMRAEGIPVGLQATRRARDKARTARPRLEGVRIFTTDDGMTLLVGRGARDNHRLTFKLAAPDDFWFHAQGCRGAHVVLRNEERLAQPPEASLRQAAAAAAWFSQAREQDRVDVQWTRRKNVRKPRSAPLGSVVLKRFEVRRVRPAVPRESGP